MQFVLEMTFYIVNTALANVSHFVRTLDTEPETEQQNVSDAECNVYNVFTTHPLFSFTLNGLILTVVSTLGTIFNICNLIIFGRQQASYSGLKPYLVSLTIWDTLLLLSGWLLFSLPLLIHEGEMYSYGWQAVIYVCMYPLCMICMTASVFSHVAITIERYMALCHTLLHRRMNRKFRMRLALGGIIVFSIGVNIPKFFEYYLATCTLNNVSYWATDLWILNEPAYVVGYYVMTDIIWNTLGPFILLLVLNTCIARTMRRSEAILTQDSAGMSLIAAAQRNQRTTRYRERQLTTMLVIVVAKFLLCHVLPVALCIMDICRTYGAMDSRISTWLFHYMTQVSNAVVMMHSASNFFVYYFCQPKFRSEFATLMGQKSSGDLSQSTVMTEANTQEFTNTSKEFNNKEPGSITPKEPHKTIAVSVSVTKSLASNGHTNSVTSFTKMLPTERKPERKKSRRTMVLATV